jgi:ABC-type multidrug transport system fused ATPase/permease subunit
LKGAARSVEAAAGAERDFILGLPQNYDTPIGEGRTAPAASASAASRTRSRTRLSDPGQATSALDNESERLIQAALAEIMKNRTTFVIAHRISTVRSADRILVIENGRIHESGTHDELCRINGVYKKLYDLQFPEEKEIRP